MKIYKRKYQLFNLFKFGICLLFLAIIFGLKVNYCFSQNSHFPNVILITVDALRSDHLGCYGYKRNTSPHIDALAKKGVLFTTAIACSNYTYTSLASISTSVYPIEHGLYGSGDESLYILNPHLSTIAELLRIRGYKTMFITNHEVRRECGLSRGFDVFQSINVKAEEINKLIIEWIKKCQGDPFFLWIHYFGSHGPYLPPPPYDKLFLQQNHKLKGKQIPISQSQNMYECYKVIPGYVAQKGITDADYYISQYDGAIRYTDEKIGELWDFVKGLDLAKNTLLIITADHGESLGEHDLYFSHGITPYENQIRVPLIITFSSLVPASRIIDAPVSHIDIMPTILDLLDMNKPEQIKGYSLSRIILNKENPYQDRGLYFEHKNMLDSDYHMAYRTKDWKIMRIKQGKAHDYRYLFYNLKEDPYELNNLVEIKKERFSFMKEKLEEYLKQADSAVVSKKIILDDAAKEKLRSLGYIQ